MLENTGSLTLTVIRNGGSSGSVTVDYATQDSSAGELYTSVPGPAPANTRVSGNMTSGGNVDSPLIGRIIAKGLILYVLGRAFRLKGRDRWLFTLSLAQAGEFGFVLIAFSVQRDVIPVSVSEKLLLVIALGCLIDSISIMLIMLPIALPVANAAGFDLIWFGVLTVVAVEVGLLTPPFGLSVYTIKSAMDDPDLKVGEIFRGAFPFVVAMLVSLGLIIAFPSIATWLARL